MAVPTDDEAARRRLASSVSLAAAIHTALAVGLVAGSRVPAPREPPAHAPVDDDAAVELEVDTRVGPRDHEREAPERVAHGTARGALLAPRSEPRRAVATEPQPTEPPPPAPGSWSLPSPTKARATIDAANPFLTAELGLGDAGAPPSRAAAPAEGFDALSPDERAAAILRMPAREREQALGLGPDGPVLRVLGEATYASRTAANGRARFRVRIAGDGALLSIDVVDASSDSRAWSAVADEAAARLRGRPLRLARGSRGAELEVEIASREQLPSGADPGFSVDVAGRALKRGRGPRSSRLSLLRVPKVVVTPAAPTEYPSSLPMVGVVVELVSVAVDPSDLGASPRRLVQSRVVRAREL